MRSLEFFEWVNLSLMELDKVGEVRRMAVAALIMIFTIIGFAVYDQIGLTPDFVAMAGGLLRARVVKLGLTNSI